MIITKSDMNIPNKSHFRHGFWRKNHIFGYSLYCFPKRFHSFEICHYNILKPFIYCKVKQYWISEWLGICNLIQFCSKWSYFIGIYYLCIK